MPKWLSKQLKEAYKSKDHRQIKYLNECWLSFQNCPENTPLKKLKKRDHI